MGIKVVWSRTSGGREAGREENILFFMLSSF